MHAVVVGTSIGADVAESPNHLHGNGSRQDVAHSFCSPSFFAPVNDRSISFSYWTPPWTQAHGEAWSNWPLDGQPRCASQNFGNWTIGGATNRSASDVGRSAKRQGALGRCDRHREHHCVLRHCAQNCVINLVTQPILNLKIASSHRVLCEICQIGAGAIFKDDAECSSAL